MSAFARGHSKGWLAARQNRVSGEGAARLQYGIQISSFDPMATTTTSIAHLSHPSFHIDREATAFGVHLRRDGTANDLRASPRSARLISSAYRFPLVIPPPGCRMEVRNAFAPSPKEARCERVSALLRPRVWTTVRLWSAGYRRHWQGAGHQSGACDGIPE